MFNHGIRGRRGGDNSGITGLSAAYVEARSPAVTISGYQVSGIDVKALDTAGGQTIIVTGGGFATGITGTIGGVAIGAITYISPTQVSFTSPAKSGGLYVLVLTNTNGSTGALIPGIVYSSVPTFTTTGPSIGTFYETTNYSPQVVATSDSAITYTLSSGSLPPGATLNPSTGVISGSVPVIASGSTTYNFFITATDNELQDVTRNFTITLSTDVLTWVTPSNGATINLDGSAYSQTLTATDGAGYGVTYTADTLPAGLTLSAGTISGTPTVEGTVSTVLTATAATTTRSQTNNISWVISLADAFFKYTPLLISANSSSQTQSFVSDNSLNNNQLTVVGDTRATNFTPYQNGFYSIQFNGSTDYITYPASAAWDFGSGSFTIECWIRVDAITATNQCFAFHGWSGSGAFNYGWNAMVWATNGQLSFYANGTQTNFTDLVISPAAWTHVAFVGSGGVLSAYKNGVKSATTYTYTSIVARPTMTVVLGGWNNNNETIAERYWFGGCISNFRILKGTALYSATFTPPTSPLNTTSTTVLLTAQRNRFDDSSTNVVATIGSAPKIVGAHPFATPTTATYNTQYGTYFPSAVTNFLSVPHNANLTITSGSTDSFIAECWVYFNTVTASTAILDKAGQNTVTFQNWSLNVDSAGKFQIIWGGTGSPGSQIGFISGTTVAVAGQWYHLAYVKTNADWALFVNGTREASYNGLNTANDSTLNPLRIGSDTFSSQSVNGIIADVRIYKGATAGAPYLATNTTLTVPTSRLTAITGTQLLTCQDSTFKDNSTNNYTVTGNGLAQPIPATPFTQTTSSVTLTGLGSGFFDGTGDYLTATIPPFGTGDFTIESWFFYLPGFTANNSLFQINTSGFGGSGTLLFSSYSGTICIGTGILTSAPGIGVSTPVNRWSHFALVRSSGVTKFYLDGVLQSGFGTSGSSTDATNYTFTNLIIGGAGASTQLLGGYMADFRITRTAVYTSNFTPTFTPLTNVTNTQLLTLQTNGQHNNSSQRDQTGFNNILTRNGNITSGTFTPFGDNWSVYFNGSSSLSITPTSALNLGNTYTYEMWALIPTGTNNKQLLGGGSTKMLIGTGGSSSTVGVLRFYDGTSVYLGDSAYLIANDKWNHIAVVRESTGTNGFKMYVNGILVYVGTNSSGLATPPAYTVGGYNSSTDLITAYISNLRISSTAIYTTSSTTIGTQVFTPSTTPLTSTTNTLFFTCCSNKFEDLSPINYAVTVNGAPAVQKFSPFSTVTVPKYYSTYFPGTANSITFTGNTSTRFTGGDWTFEAWLYLSGSNSETYPPILKDLSSGGGFILNGSTNSNKNFAAGSAVGPTFVTVNAWHHVAAVRSGTTLTAYVDGVPGTPVTGDVTIGATPSWIIGSDGTSRYFYGYLSNMRIVKGQALYTGTFTPGTSPLTTTTVGTTGANVAASLTGTVSFLGCKDSTLIDNSTNAFSMASTTGVVINPVSPFTPTISTTQLSYSQSTFGSSFYMDGTGDYLTAPNTKSFDLSAGQWTIECWFYQIAAKQVQLFSISAALWRLDVSSTQLVDFVFNTSSVQTSTDKAPLNQWNHVAVSYNADGTTTAVKLFVNGKYQNGGQFIPGADTTSLFYIGNNKDAAGAWDFNGYMTDVRITKGQSLYNAGFSNPTSPAQVTPYTAFLANGNINGVIDVTRTIDMETVGDSKIVKGVSPYNGNYYGVAMNSTTSDNFGVTPGTFGANDFTIEFFANISVTTGTALFNNWRWYNGLTPGSIGIFIDASSILYGTVYTGGGNVYDGAPTTSATIQTTLTNYIGKWLHIALCRQGANIYLAVNGVIASSSTLTSNTALNLESRTGYNIGAWNANGGGPAFAYEGYMSNFRIVKGTALYTTTYTVPTGPLTAIPGTTLLTFQSNKFIDNSTSNLTLTINGSPKVKTQNPFQVNTGQSLYFDGTGDYLTTPYSPSIDEGTSQFTWEAWVYPTSLAHISKIIDGSGTNEGFMQIETSGALTVGRRAIANDISGGTVPLNQWTHVAASRDSSNALKIYVNGTVVGTSTSNTNNYGPGGSTRYIGSDSTGAYTFTGYIADLRITKYARTITVPLAPVKTN